MLTLFIQKTAAAEDISRILFRNPQGMPAAIICLRDQNPELVTLRAAARSLFGLAAEGVCLCDGALAYHPVGSYPTFSPLPGCPGGLLSVALSFLRLMVRSILLS